MYLISLVNSGWPEATQKVCSLCVHVAVDGEELTLEENGEQLTEGGLSTPEREKESLF